MERGFGYIVGSSPGRGIAKALTCHGLSVAGFSFVADPAVLDRIGTTGCILDANWQTLPPLGAHMKNRQDVLAMIAVACAVVMTGVTIYGQIIRPRSSAPELQPSKIDNWEALTAAGLEIGSPTARLTIVEFADFQCPYCKQYKQLVLDSLLAKYPTDVRILYRHLPISTHANAVPAAIAAECGARQGQFRPIHDALYEHIDTLDRVPTESLSARLGVGDQAAFVACLGERGPREAITRDTALSRTVNAKGTPTIIANGTIYPTPPPLRVLEKLLQR